jgi:hypothetical protein
MKITCYSCDKTITKLGALVFSPPTKSNQAVSVSTVHKFHICMDCWPMLMKCIDHLDETKIIKEKR